jgi:hypothetical protein
MRYTGEKPAAAGKKLAGYTRETCDMQERNLRYAGNQRKIEKK